MKKQITSISSFQTSKVVAVLYFIITIPFIILFAIASMFAPGGRSFGIFFMILAPFLYALIGFVFCFIGTWLYNQVVKFVGGIEYTTTETRDF